MISSCGRLSRNIRQQVERGHDLPRGKPSILLRTFPEAPCLRSVNGGVAVREEFLDSATASPAVRAEGGEESPTERRFAGTTRTACFEARRRARRPAPMSEGGERRSSGSKVAVAGSDRGRSPPRLPSSHTASGGAVPLVAAGRGASRVRRRETGRPGRRTQGRGCASIFEKAFDGFPKRSFGRR